MVKKIAVFTSTRAEFGLLKKLCELLENSPKFELQLYVTGTHLSDSFGKTISEIHNSNLPIFKTFEINLDSNSHSAVTKAAGLAILSLSDSLANTKPDLSIVLGDRTEMLAISLACHFMNIPIAHLHGGEKTEGAIDDSIRHAITKLSSLHFCACEEFRKRIIQLGERPDKVFNVGAMANDHLLSITPFTLEEIEKNIQLKLKDQKFLVTFHPVTTELDQTRSQIKNLLLALESFISNSSIVFTHPNSDTNNHIIIEEIQKFVEKHSNSTVLIPSLGQRGFISCLIKFDAIIGNSSSGIIEAPLFKIPCVNIGTRQQGRPLSSNIIGSEYSSKEINDAILTTLTENFKLKAKQAKSPFGEAGAAEKILNILKNTEFRNLIRKSFYDLP
jgi:UDP-hydrolysing UDP-N-acetyl-D-glucosamine 2-epimerase